MDREITAAGIDALTVMPIFKPRYALAAPNITEIRHPVITAVIVSSDIDFDAGMYGLNVTGLCK